MTMAPIMTGTTGQREQQSSSSTSNNTACCAQVGCSAPEAVLSAGNVLIVSIEEVSWLCTQFPALA